MNRYIITAAAAILFGAVILVFPQVLNYVVAAYLIVIGITGLVNSRR